MTAERKPRAWAGKCARVAVATIAGLAALVAAWLRYQFTGDAQAEAAFRGAQPELLRNPAWFNQAAKHLDPARLG